MQLMKAYRAETSYKPRVILASEAEGITGSIKVCREFKMIKMAASET